MKLKKLEIKGFKSFADKTEINFNENITGIVGPNGCGKSNIIDAIRWVLGEQKTSNLRLEKMDNVIFNGTKSRKSTGLAEVSITFENTKNLMATDFTEVKITRRIYKSGDTEYRLNDIKCRLKDVKNVFNDTGISNDSYAIIELGMVDEILHNKDNSRKKLFEQAASISKYKKRKKESLQKLKSTEENLERLEDILAELEANLKTLESQARRAKRYYEIKEEYKELSLESLKTQVKEYKENFNDTSQSLKTANEQKQKLSTDIQAKESQIQKSKLVSLEKEKNLSEIQKKINELTSGISKNENERNILREKISYIKETISNLKNELGNNQVQITNYEKDVKEIESEINGLQENFSILTNERKIANEKLKSKEEELNKNKLLIENEKKQISDIQSSLFELEKKHGLLNNQIEFSNSNFNRFQDKIKELTAKLKLNEKELIDLTSLKEKKNKEEQSIKEKETSLNDKLQKTTTEVDALNITIQQKYRLLDSKRNESNILKSMMDSLDGFPESVQYLKKNKPLFKDKNVFSDIINCDDKYKAAIEFIIAPFLNYFIVDTIEQGYDTISSLKSSQKGKAGMFVLEKIEKINKTMPNIKGLKPLKDIIDIDKKYTSLVESLFFNYYISDTDEIEANILDKYPEAKIVNIDGTLSIDNTILQGGSNNIFEGANVGRKQNHDKLLSEIKNIEKEVTDIEVTLKKSKSEKSKIETELSEIKNSTIFKESIQINEKYSSKNLLINSLKEELERQNKERESHKSLKEKASVEIEEVVKNLKLAKKTLESLKSTSSKNNDSIDRFLDQFNTIRDEYHAIEIKFNEQKNKLDNLQERKTFYTTKKLEIEQSIERNKTRIEQLDKEQAQHAETLSRMEISILDNYNDKESIQKSIEDSEKEFFISRNKIVEDEGVIKELQSNLNTHNEYVHSLESHIQEMKINIQSIKERLSIEFSIELNDFINTDLTTTQDPALVLEKVARLKKRLETYGEINSLAIESFNEMKKRYDFLTTQKQDILDAKDTLLETIKEIDEKALELFTKSFTQVRENFIKTFRILFSEDDDCDLILTNPEDPLESDIEIIAKPKGKKPLTINQLSGGEKTLTATALLFSLYLLKPAPFCIFDEVDAPLDDTNIAKFNNIIEKFSKKSQFIIVTHNKQTMASVEVLYGVTMIEQGVSKVVPVDFRQIKATG